MARPRNGQGSAKKLAQRARKAQTLQADGAQAMLSEILDALARPGHFTEEERFSALEALKRLGTAIVTQHVDVVVARLEDSDGCVRAEALETLSKLEPAKLAQHLDAVVARFTDSDPGVREQALYTLTWVDPATLVPYADAVVARLEDSDSHVRAAAIKVPVMTEPATLALHGDAVAALLGDENRNVRLCALMVLSTLRPARLALFADAVVAQLRSPDVPLRVAALDALGRLEPERLALHGFAVIMMLHDLRFLHVCHAALNALCRLPHFVTRGIAAFNPVGMASGHRPHRHIVSESEYRQVCVLLPVRLRWYKCRLFVRVRRLVQYWYALPYRPSGPGHARDVEAWNQMQM